MADRTTAPHAAHLAAEALTIVGPDTLIRGEIVCQSAMHVLGKVEGKVVSQGHLHLGEGSLCKAAVQGVTVVIEGTVEGNVLATERLDLKPSAIVKGDITATKLVTNEGAAFSGHCAIGADAVAAAQRAESQPQTAAATRAGPAPTIVKPSIPMSGQSAASIAGGTPDVDSALAGLEAKLAGFSRARE